MGILDKKNKLTPEEEKDIKAQAELNAKVDMFKKEFAKLRGKYNLDFIAMLDIKPQGINVKMVVAPIK